MTEQERREEVRRKVELQVGEVENDKGEKAERPKKLFLRPPEHFEEKTTLHVGAALFILNTHETLAIRGLGLWACVPR